MQAKKSKKDKKFENVIKMIYFIEKPAKKRQKKQKMLSKLKILRQQCNKTQEEVAKACHANKNNVSAWELGKRPVPVKHWKTLAQLYNVDAATIQRLSAEALSDYKSYKPEAMFYTEPITQDKLFPVLGAAAAANVNTVAYPLAEYARDNAERMVFFPDGQPGDFVIEVSGNSMEPWYPDGTLLLVRGNVKIRRGERVVAIMEDGEVLFKIFADKGDKIALFSIDDKGKDFYFDRSNTYQIKGIYRVIASLRNEAQLDNAMEQAGVHHRWENKYNEME